MVETHPRDFLSEMSDRVPPERLSAYSWLWQFETWLRTMVYVELRARYGDSWETNLTNLNHGAYKKDKKLTHMPTRESLPTSYMQLGDLLRTISSNWRLFAPYLPPKKLWNAKLEEISQIRHRVAHFRLGGVDDSNSIEQLLRDIDKGFWHFCTSYNESSSLLPHSKDAVMKEFLHLDPFPWSEVEPSKWLRVGMADPNLVVSVTFEISRRRWLKSQHPAQVAGKYGYFYDLTLGARDNRRFEYSLFLRNTKSIHHKLCHICLNNFSDSIRFTIPTLLGKKAIIEIIKTLIDVAQYSVRPGRDPVLFEKLSESANSKPNVIDSLAEQWPEYVLGPSNPLTFLDPDMPCSFFGVK